MEYTIITGASSGIGKELAFTYAKNGHHLLLIARRYENLIKIKNEIQGKYNVLIECIRCDLSNLQDVNRVFSKIVNEYSINCVINNAGIGIFEDVLNITEESLMTQTNINFYAPVIISKLFIPALMANRGSLITICSVLSYLPNAKSSIYVANKHALYGFSNTIRLEHPNLHVLTVHPKTVKTNFFQDETYLNKTKGALLGSEVANKIYKAYKLKKRKLNLPKTIFFLNLVYLIMPKWIDKLNQRFFSNK